MYNVIKDKGSNKNKPLSKNKKVRKVTMKIKPENLAKVLLKRAYQNDFDAEQEKSINNVLDRIKESAEAKGSTFADDYAEFYQLLINLAD